MRWLVLLLLLQLQLMFGRVQGDESACAYVSSRGLMKSCDVFPVAPQSSATELYPYDWRTVANGSVVYVPGSTMRAFINGGLPWINARFSLVTGDCDDAMPTDVLDDGAFAKFIGDDRVLHWFSQNLVIEHPKMTGVPIGMDYHTLTQSGGYDAWGGQLSAEAQESMLVKTRQRAPPMGRRAIVCYGNYQFTRVYKRHPGERTRALAQIPHHLAYMEPGPLQRAETWKAQSLMLFVVSPFGEGYDCHRTWEALALGGVPIVRTSPVDHLFEGLPVWIVASWSDITAASMHDTRVQFLRRSWTMDRITLAYWVRLIRTTTADAMQHVK